MNGTIDSLAENTQLDFFNPLQVSLESFEGPLELLLALIRKQKMDIHEISLAEICEPYLAYLEHLETLNLEIAGQFIEVAATLIYIKSKSLLPKIASDEESEEPLDTEEVLRQKLIEYQQFKDTAYTLSQMEWLGRDVFSRPSLDEEVLVDEFNQQPPQFENLTIYNLLKTYQLVLSRKRVYKPHEVEPDLYSIEKRMLELMEIFCVRNYSAFHDLVAEYEVKMDEIVTFMAVLELVKQKFLQIKQMEVFGTIHCYAISGEKERAEELRKDLLLSHIR